MLVERHYDDESLIAMMEADRVRDDDHLPSCTVCNEKLESFRSISTALHDNTIWDTREIQTAPNPTTIATLRAFADRMSAEDAAAAQILPELLAGPREEWMPRLQEHPEWRTAGVVRGLVGKARQTINSNAHDALLVTALATEIAEGLAHNSNDVTLVRLSGVAWRERAYALFYSADAHAALIAIGRAESEFARCSVADYDFGRLSIIKALTLRLLERYSDASIAATAAAAIFEVFADDERWVSARLTEVHLLFSGREFARADAILAELDAMLVVAPAVETHARVLANRGYAAWQSGRVTDGLRYFEVAAALFDGLEITTEAVRVRWNASLMLAENGLLADAISRLQSLSHEMERLGMTSEAALNALQLSDILLVEGRYADVERLCRAAMESFERAGLAYTARALTALGYLREAAQQRTADRALLKNVGEYIRRLPSEPQLLFAYAAE